MLCTTNTPKPVKHTAGEKRAHTVSWPCIYRQDAMEASRHAQALTTCTVTAGEHAWRMHACTAAAGIPALLAGVAGWWGPRSSLHGTARLPAIGRDEMCKVKKATRSCIKRQAGRIARTDRRSKQQKSCRAMLHQRQPAASSCCLRVILPEPRTHCGQRQLPTQPGPHKCSQACTDAAHKPIPHTTPCGHKHRSCCSLYYMSTQLQHHTTSCIPEKMVHAPQSLEDPAAPDTSCIQPALESASSSNSSLLVGSSAVRMQHSALSRY